MHPLRIVFAGTPEFAATVQAALLDSSHRVVAAYTQPDRPAGRGRSVKASPVKLAASAAGVAVCQPQSLRAPDAADELSRFAPDIAIVAAYGLLLPPAILAVPRLGCVNVHASLLPRWRGAAPIQRAIIAGDRETGVSIMQMDAGLDTGDVIERASCEIAPDDTAASLHDRLAALGAETLLECLDRIGDGSATRQPQDAALATYAPRIERDEARIDWTEPAQAIERHIRAFDPWPVTHTFLNGERLRIWRAEAHGEPAQAPPGTVQSANRDGIDVATGDRVLRLTTIQRPGGRRISAADYLNSQPSPEGIILGT